ncbi:MAG: hypothetical protein U0892_20505 [Pirellulales bacterium]
MTKPWLSFLIAGGTADNLVVQVVSEESGQVLGKATGGDNETLHREYIDLSSYVGRLVRVRLVDHKKEKGGSLKFDDVRLHEKK